MTLSDLMSTLQYFKLFFVVEILQVLFECLRIVYMHLDFEWNSL